MLIFFVSIPCSSPAPTHPPQVPRIMVYISRHSVCMLDTVIFGCILLRRIIRFIPAHSLTPNILSQEVFFSFLEEKESLCPLLVFISKEAVFAKCYFESHGLVGVVVKRGLACFRPELENTLLSVFCELVSIPLGCPLPSSTMCQGDFEGGDGPS